MMDDKHNLTDERHSWQKKLDDVWPIGKRSAYFTCLIAFLLGMFDIMDRQIIAALFPYLKAEYALSDAQLGSLMSIVNVSIAVLVVPSGYLIDRWSRKKMIFIMGLVWSVATGACAFAGSYSHLLMARFVVGAGEAGYNPAAQSLLAASFPRRLRTTAAGLAQFGMTLGAPIGLILGAVIATHWGWRHALGVVAVPGLLISFLALKVKDFKTVTDDPTTGTDAPVKEPYGRVVLNLLKTPTLLCIFLGAAMLLIHSGMAQSWLPTYYNRVAKLPMTMASSITALGFVISAAAIVGGGPLIDWARTKKSNAAPIWLCFVMLVCGLGNVWAFGFAAPGSLAQIAVIIGSGLFGGTVATVGTAMVLDLALPSQRGTAVSLLIMIQNLLGYTVGPFLTGLISDMFDLSTGMTVVSCVYFIGMVCYFIASYTYDRDRAKIKETDTQFA